MEESVRTAISNRFIACVDELLKNGTIRSYKQYSESIGIKPQSLNDIKGERRAVTVEIIYNTCKTYNVNNDFIFFGEGTPLKKEKKQVNNSIITVEKESGKENIALVSTKAAAGYADRFIEPEFYKDLPTFSLPSSRFRNGTFRAFEISGDSMSKRINNGDWVIAQKLESPQTIIDNYIHIVVLENEVVCKRILNRVEGRGRLRLKSDNPTYQDYEVEMEEVKEIWQVKCSLSFDLSNPDFDMMQVVNKLENEFFDFRKEFEEVKKRVNGK